MFVLYPRDPVRCQLGKVWTTPNEVVRVRPDRYIVCFKQTTSNYLGRKGFIPVDLMSLKEAAKKLNYPVPVLLRWGKSGKVTIFSSDENSYIPVTQVNKLKLDKEQNN